ncbi:Uncharacterised protein [Klebsiella pneumoniae]|nr:Uncharacterised protein [Klebsiella pneumoniae]
MPDCPAISRCQLPATPLPNGPIRPMPVITTLLPVLFNMMTCRLGKLISVYTCKLKDPHSIAAGVGALRQEKGQDEGNGV